jgi:CHASE2 domain-containing sensor protein
VSEESAPRGGQKFVLLKRLLRALPVIVLVSLLTFALDHFGWLKSFETATLDRFFILREPAPAQKVALVEIDDDDYQQLFHETSPLDPETLSDVIEAIARNQPKLIAIDIDTSATVFKEMKIPPALPPLVWARGARQSFKDAGASDTSRMLDGEDVFVPEKVLGKLDPPGTSTGIALMPLDSDSQIRHFRREYPVTSGEGASTLAGKADSFHWAILKKYCELMSGDRSCENLTRHQPIDAGHGEQDLILNLAIDPYEFETPIKASRVLDEANTGNVNSSSPVFLSLKDKIVLLGGRYEASRDYYDTPTGAKYGLDLAAIAVESELSGTGIRHANHLVLIIMEVLAGLTLVVINYLFPRGWKHLIALAAIPFVGLFGSLIVFSSLALWANFIPTLVATQIHVLYDKLAESRHLEREVSDLRTRLGSYEQQAKTDVVNLSEKSDDAPEGPSVNTQESLEEKPQLTADPKAPKAQ